MEHGERPGGDNLEFGERVGGAERRVAAARALHADEGLELRQRDL